MKRFAPSYILLIVATAVFSGGVWWLIIPKLQELALVRAQINQLHQTSLVSKTGSKSLVVSKIAQRQQVLQLLPVDDQQYDLAVELEGLSRDVGVSLTGLSMSAIAGVAAAGTKPAATAAAAVTAPKMLTITLGVSGNYAAVRAFVNGLPTLSRFILITQLTLTGAPVGAASAKLGTTDAVTASLTATAPYLPLSAALTKK